MTSKQPEQSIVRKSIIVMVMKNINYIYTYSIQNIYKLMHIQHIILHTHILYI